MLNITYKKEKTTALVVTVAIIIVIASLFFEAWLLQLILTWFHVKFSLWQTLTMVFLANMIAGGSSK